jgi:hypothetical protein
MYRPSPAGVAEKVGSVFAEKLYIFLALTRPFSEIRFEQDKI